MVCGLAQEEVVRFQPSAADLDFPGELHTERRSLTPAQEEVVGFQPSVADLDFPGKLQRLAQAQASEAAGGADQESPDANPGAGERDGGEQAPLARDGVAAGGLQVR